MLNKIKKVLVLGISAASLTKKKAEKFAGSLVDKGVIKKGDAKKLAKGLVRNFDRLSSSTKKFVKVEAKRLAKKSSKVSMGEFRYLKSEVAALKKELFKRAKAMKKKPRKKPVKKKKTSTKKKKTKRKRKK